MARHRTFTMGPPPTVDDRVTFDVVGQYTTRPTETWSETFSTVGLAPAGVLEDLTSAIQLGADGRRRYNTMSCMGFIRGVIIEDDRERFEALARDPDRLVGLVELVQVVAWLSDEITLRPTQPSSGSTPGGGSQDGVVTRVDAVA